MLEETSKIKYKKQGNPCFGFSFFKTLWMHLIGMERPQNKFWHCEHLLQLFTLQEKKSSNLLILSVSSQILPPSIFLLLMAKAAPFVSSFWMFSGSWQHICNLRLLLSQAYCSLYCQRLTKLHLVCFFCVATFELFTSNSLEN